MHQEDPALQSWPAKPKPEEVSRRLQPMSSDNSRPCRNVTRKKMAQAPPILHPSLLCRCCAFTRETLLNNKNFPPSLLRLYTCICISCASCACVDLHPFVLSA
jgi:hypothetical protein